MAKSWVSLMVVELVGAKAVVRVAWTVAMMVVQKDKKREKM